MIRKRLLKSIALFFACNLMYEICFPTLAFALTGGPSQPEVESFEPVGTTEMVDLATGDFNYNIPLLDVEGYPINISYHGGVTMDQEASWVGLGWNINPGVINRNMRGLPDDMNAGVITKSFHMLPNVTHGLTVDAFNKEIFGKEEDSKNAKSGAQQSGKSTDTLGSQAQYKLMVTCGVSYNNYRGTALELMASIGINGALGNKLPCNGSLGVDFSSQNGFTMSPSVGFGLKTKLHETANQTMYRGGLSVKASTTFNSQAGLKRLTLSANADVSSSKTRLHKNGNPQKYDAMNIGGGLSSHVSFGTTTYTPHVSMPMRHTCLNIPSKLGVIKGGKFKNVSFQGFGSTQEIAVPEQSKFGYGYLYTQNKRGDDALLDFNLEKDGSFTGNSTNLPFTNFTYDLYSVSGQGIGAQYRPYRSDIGIVHDDVQTSTSSSDNAGAEAGIGKDTSGNLQIHLGTDITVSSSQSRSGKWTRGNAMASSMDFLPPNKKTDPLYEPAYFKNVGEKTPIDKDFYEGIGSDWPVRVVLKPSASGDDFVATRQLLPAWSSEDDPSPAYINAKVNPLNNVRKKREKRNQVISYMTALEASVAGLDKKIKAHEHFGDGPDFEETQVAHFRWFTSPYRKPLHLSEITALNPEGMRYVYGIAAYNTMQKEETFNVNSSNVNCSTGKATYTSQDASVNNVNGHDNYYSSTATPGYAHSYLLTAILSPDYVDVTENGVTFDDDLGTAVKINYGRLYNDYRWRTPYTDAYHSVGHISDTQDDKGSVISGEKEIWYVRSIESKNYIARFNFDQRQDGLGAISALDETKQPLYRLTKITLYSKIDLERNGANAVPIKTVYFEYDYSLCPNTENNSGKAVYQNGIAINPSETDSVNDPVFNVNKAQGKLTLRKIYFTYGKSEKAALSPYRFYYATNPESSSTAVLSDRNPAYHIKGYDRWGGYKPFPESVSCYDPTGPLTNANYPFSEQDKIKADVYAAAWSLTRIDLPSGGSIRVTYESDDYAYVQNKRAMQMFTLLGAGSITTVDGEMQAVPYDYFYDYQDGGDQFEYLFFKLDTNERSHIGEYFLDDYGLPRKNFYFNVLVDLKQEGKNYEYVPGYAEIDASMTGGKKPYGTVLWNDWLIGYVRVKMVAIGDREAMAKQVNPICRTAWQYARLQMPELVHPGSNPRATNESAIRGLVTSLEEVTTLWKSFNRTLLNKKYARKFIPHRSWIRLNNPDKCKMGGGARVKKLRLVDNWEDMNTASGYTGSSYGQEYDYTTTEPYGSQTNIHAGASRATRTISSGVAAYEPMIGNEENPWREPIYTDVKNVMAPDDRFYTEAPYGESVFPAPTVIYGIVTVRNIQYTNVKRNATGKTIHEFYTAKEYPIIVKQTGLTRKHSGKHKILPPTVEDNMTASQGYSVELNDMHGKPKGQWVYAEGNNEGAISGVAYEYYSDTLFRFYKRLNNQVPVYDKNTNRISTAIVGTDVDFVLDSREQYTNSSGSAAQLNVEIIQPPSALLILPTAFGNFSSENTRFRSITATKVINKFGILKKTIAIENGSTVETENTLFDSETGGVLLTRTRNEYKDIIYNLTTPAHYAYEGMGGAYKNIGAVFNKVWIGIDTIMLQGGEQPTKYFYPGDEVVVIAYDGYYIAPVFEHFGEFQHLWFYTAPNGKSFFMDHDGYPANYLNRTHPCYVKIIRSGRRNLQTLPIQQITSLVNPINVDSLRLNSSTQVINASAAVFSDEWGAFCNLFQTKTVCFDTLDPDYAADLFAVLNGLATQNKFDSTGNVDSIGTYYDTSFFAVGLQSQGCSIPSTSQHSYTAYLPSHGVGPDEFTMKGLFKVNKFGDSGPECNCAFYLHNPDSNPCITYTATFAYPGGFVTLPLEDVASYLTSNGINPADTFNLLITAGYTTGCNWAYNFDSIVGFVNNIRHGGYYFGSDPGHAFQIDAIYNNGDTVTLSGKLECNTNKLRTLCTKYCDMVYTNGDRINPYVWGLRGHWRKKKDLLYLTERNYTSNKGNIRKDGTYKTFNPYWKPAATNLAWQADTNNWTWTSEVTRYSPHGFEIENRDALNRYSAALYTNTNLPVAVASNAKLRQIAFDGFEDLKYSLPGCKLEHWNFKNDISGPSVTIDTQESHSGNQCLKIAAGKSHFAARKIFDCSEFTPSSDDTSAYLLKPCDCMDRFSPDTAQKYVLSGWVKESPASGSVTSNYSASAIIELVSASGFSTLTLKPAGPIIEGWQRIDTTFYVPYGTLAINVQLRASYLQISWFDDLRIHPFDAKMKSYVYNPVSLKLMAELDENNFSTFYEYDAEGALIRVKKETQRGIVTLKEARNSSSRLFQP